MESTLQFDQEMAERAQTVNQFVENYLAKMDLPQGKALSELQKSMLYSATNGGKRFRPVLSMLIAEALKIPVQKVLPFATAVEFVHTYSLIHDDLPCMDNDDIRRGKPTNHKVYGEDFALLAGDALLTEAFLVIVDAYQDRPELATRLVRLLSQAAGVRGMVGGQAIDLRAGQDRFTPEELTHLHVLKTGALIRVSVEGAALIAGVTDAQMDSLRKFGEGLGLAFQVADDILDHGEKDQDVRSFTGILGFDETKSYLAEISDAVTAELRKVVAQAPLLEKLVHYNAHRKV